MRKGRIFLPVLIVSLIALVLIATSFQLFPAPAMANNGNPHLVKTFIGQDGKEIDELIFPEKPPNIKVEPVKVPKANPPSGTNSLSNVPAFYWSYGCSATSAAMLFGYYDRNNRGNFYKDSSTVCPLTNSVWGQTTYPGVTCGECPLSATHNGVDGLTSKGHVDDYWIDYNNASDPYLRDGFSARQNGDCAGDFMGTNQSKYGNNDGSTTFYFYTDGSPNIDYVPSNPDSSRDGAHGMKLFAESRTYTGAYVFNQYIQGYRGLKKGFTFANYVAEIDASRPVLIQVDGHTMLGYGYDKKGSIVYLHDTWDYSDHSMTWGGRYSKMQHYGVTVFRLP